MEDEGKREETLVLVYTRLQTHTRRRDLNESKIYKRKPKPQPLVA